MVPYKPVFETEGKARLGKLELSLEELDTIQEHAFISYYTRKIRIDPDLKEEAFQEARIRYLLKSSQYEGEGHNHAGILIGITRNVYRELIGEKVTIRNKRIRHYEKIKKEDLFQASADDELVQEEEERQRTLDRQKIEESFSEGQRQVYHLLVTQGMTRQEAINHLGINKNTFDSRLNAMRKIIRKISTKKEPKPFTVLN